MSEVNIFEKASRVGLCFETAKGRMNVTDLWSLPMTQGAVNLNDLAKDVKRELAKLDDQEGLVKTVKRGTQELNLKLAILTHIFEVRTVEQDADRKRQENAKISQRLAELIERKQDQELEGKTVEELQAMLEATKS